MITGCEYRNSMENPITGDLIKDKANDVQSGVNRHEQILKDMWEETSSAGVCLQVRFCEYRELSVRQWEVYTTVHRDQG